MKPNILKLTIPAILLGFAGSSFASPATSTGTKAMTGIQTVAKADTTAADSELGKKVQQKLQSDKRLTDTSIKTDVASDGSILLRGTVESTQQSQIAERLASTVSGVSKVKNELQVPRGE